METTEAATTRSLQPRVTLEVPHGLPENAVRGMPKSGRFWKDVSTKYVHYSMGD